MKRRLFITLFILFSCFLLSPTRLYAEGQACCQKRYNSNGDDLLYHYDQMWHVCTSSYNGYPNYLWDCLSGEICLGQTCSLDPNVTPTTTPTSTPTTTPTINPSPTNAACGNMNQDCCPPTEEINDDGTINILYTCNDNTMHCIDQTSSSPGTCVSLSTPSSPPVNEFAASNLRSPFFCNPLDQNSGIKTAIGCIPTSNPNDFITAVLRIATGIGGGIALALILYGVFIVTTSAGNPDKLKMGSEIITSAVIGLIFILLSVFLVNFIGINILGIPGLT